MKLSELGHEEGIETKIRQLELEIASRRNYEKVVGILGAAVVAVGALVAWFGFDSFSDIKQDVRDQVVQSLKSVSSETSTSLDKFEEYDGRMGILLESLTEAEGRWRNSIQPALMELSGDIPDLKGQFLSMMKDGEKQDSQQDPVWRRQAAAVVHKIVEHLEEAQSKMEVSQFAPSDIFNVAQLSRQVSRYDLERRLVVAAHEAKSDSTSARALYLQSEARRTSPGDDTAFQELMELVAYLTNENPHIVLAEAWNAAENQRRYDALIKALDVLIERGEEEPGTFLPSYAYALKGQVHLRRGLVGEVDMAVEYFVEAVKRLKLEGTHSQWAVPTVELISSMRTVLVNSGANIESLDESVLESGIELLILRYANIPELLDHLSNPMDGTGGTVMNPTGNRENKSSHF